MAIKSLEQEPCEDAISREAVLDLCDSKDSEYKVSHLKEDVECLPSVTPTVETAEFVIENNGGTTHWYECFKCHKAIDITDNFCKCCGRKMVKPNITTNCLKGESK